MLVAEQQATYYPLSPQYRPSYEEGPTTPQD